MVAQFALNRRFQPPPRDELPPANVEAEAAILGALLFDSRSKLLDKEDEIADPWERIKSFNLIPEVFSQPSHQILFEEMTEMNKARVATDFLNVSDHLAERGLLSKIGGQGMLVHLIDSNVSSINLEEYCKLILDKYQRRKIIEKTSELTTMAYDPLTTFEEMEAKRAEINSYVLMKGIRRGVDLAIIDKEMESLGDEDSIERDLRLKNMAKRWGFGGLREMKDIHARWVLNKMLKPKSFSLSSYHKHCQSIKTDWVLPGWIPRGSQICLYGPGGVGKTRMAHSAIYALITGESWGDYEVDGAKRVLVVQSDQGDRENHQMLDIQGFYSLSKEEKERYRVIQGWSTGRLSYLKKEILDHKPDVVFIDSLSTVNVDTVTDENSMRYATPLIHWKRLAQECGCAFVVLHHANKGGGMRGTTAIHNTVDEVWQLAHRTERPNGEVILSIEKSRSRGPGQYLLKYDPDSWRWNVEGEIDGEDVLGMSDLGKRIRAWLNQTGKRHEVDEIANAIGGSANTIRKELGGLLKAGLVSAERGLSRRKVYFTHLTDPTDPTDPELIQPSGSVKMPSAELTQTHSPHGGQRPEVRHKKSTDPTDPQKTSPSPKSKSSEKRGSVGSVQENDPQPQSGTELQTDPESRINCGSERINSDQNTETPASCKKSEVNEIALPKEGQKVYAPIEGRWELVEVCKVFAKSFRAHRLEKFDKESLTSPIINGLVEWRAIPDPVYIRESAGVTDKKGRVQGWKIERTTRTHYHCRLPGMSEKTVVGRSEIQKRDLRYPDWVYEPV